MKICFLSQFSSIQTNTLIYKLNNICRQKNYCNRFKNKTGVPRKQKPVSVVLKKMHSCLKKQYNLC